MFIWMLLYSLDVSFISATLIKGTSIACTNEGQQIHLSRIFGGWSANCTICKCLHGYIQCSYYPCPPSTCSLSSNMLKTFDGVTMDYKGTCNYVLVRDKLKKFYVHIIGNNSNNNNNYYYYNNNLNNNLNNNISNHITNNNIIGNKLNPNDNLFKNDQNNNQVDHLNDQPNTEHQLKNATFHAIVVKIDNIKIRLEKNKLVRIGRKYIKLPYIVIGLLTIVNEGVNVIIRSNIGLKVIWSSDNVDIIVGREYRDNIYGLCGNNNGFKYDDLETKRSRIVDNVPAFFNSWKVGKACRKKNSISKCNHTIRAHNICNRLKELHVCKKCDLFRRYYDSCVRKVCNCGSNHKCIFGWIRSFEKLGTFYKYRHSKKFG